MSLKTRDQIEKQYKWDTESVYPSTESWEAEFGKLDELIRPLRKLKGKLNTPENVAAALRAEDKLGEVLSRLYLYAHMLEDVDTSAGENQARMARMRARYAQIAGDLAWIKPEILLQPEKTLSQWRDHEALAPYRRTLEVLVREKPHTLSVEEETLLGLASDVLGNPYEVFGKLTNADLTFPPAADSEGVEHDVTNGTFYSLLLDTDRTLRHNAFSSIYKVYMDHKNTLATLLSGVVKSHNYMATVRKFPSSLEASLFDDNIPVKVYSSLIEATRQALPAFYEYVDLRARRLGLGTDINMWDFYVPIVPEAKIDVSWDQCREWIVEATGPMGDEYLEGARTSFEERWYDVFENKGKRSGAYSTGAYGQKPFMLLNYHGTLDDVFTVAHELGHSLHTLFSHRNQPIRYADYPIFLAEIASTTNEALLHHYLLTTTDDPRLKAYLLNHLCDSFKGTVYRQTMFAEFEWNIHKHVESGQALTADWLSEYYYKLNSEYYGPGITPDKRIANEWSRIPHFYYNFYVYKYATGFAAAQVFAKRILEGGEGREQYLRLLRAGSSRDPLDIVRDAGVDLTDPKVLEEGFGIFRQSVQQLDGLLDEIEAAASR